MAGGRYRLVLARVRAGTEVLRTGGGVTLTAAECNILLDGHAALEEENARLREALVAARPFLGMAIRPRPGESVVPSVAALVDDALAAAAPPAAEEKGDNAAVDPRVSPFTGPQG